MSKAPVEKRSSIGPISSESSLASGSGSKQTRRVTIVGPTIPSTSKTSTKPDLTAAKRILRKNMSVCGTEDSVPVEQTRARSGSSGRVHFPDNQVTPEHAGEIVVQLSPDQMHADAHLGFLQDGRRYVVNLCVPRFLGDNVTVARANAHLQLKEIKTNPDKSGHEFVLELEAYHDKLVNEEIAISSPQGEFVLSVSARVLGRGKGTPMLKRGIRCIAIDQADSEMSDAATPPHHRQSDKHPSASITHRRASGGGAAALLKH